MDLQTERKKSIWLGIFKTPFKQHEQIKRFIFVLFLHSIKYPEIFNTMLFIEALKSFFNTIIST